MTAWLDGLDRAEWGAGTDPLFAVCPTRRPSREWRCWIAGGQIVTGGRYAVDGVVAPAPGLPDPVAAFARTVLSRHDPLPAYVLDIGEDADGLGAIELNPVNSAGFYNVDPAPIVAALTEIAACPPNAVR